MSEIVAGSRVSSAGGLELKALKGAGIIWFVCAALGQFTFAVLRAVNYGGDVIRGDIEAWNENLIHGIIRGDPVGNAAVAAHLALAIIITLAGPLQLIPQIRAHAPALHRWNGRIYMLTAFAISVGGLYMVWTRGVLGGLVNQVAISINAILIMAFAAVALKHAMARRIDVHQRWAMRLFLAASGVWFFRVGLMAWVTLNGGPVGVGRELDGPFAVTWAFGQYLLPLAVYELYLHARDRGGTASRVSTAALLAGLTLLMGLGIVTATLFMWLDDI